VAGVATVVCLTVATIICADGLNDHIAKSDVAVVLGAGLQDDGSQSPGGKARVIEAVTLYKRGLFSTLITSGGGSKVDEATAMRAYAIAHGMPASAVIADSGGVNTMATARDTAALMRAHGWKSVLAISQYYHMPRIRLAFAKVGVTRVSTAHAPGFQLYDLYSVPREVVAYPVYWLRQG
jgi:uncharacterized SAM-binding protein YcdF (DUF218 family)